MDAIGEAAIRWYMPGGIILIIVIRLRLYTKQVPLKVHIAFEGVINTIYMTNKDSIVLVFENMVYKLPFNRKCYGRSVKWVYYFVWNMCPCVMWHVCK